jgi:hypothetical protein
MARAPALQGARRFAELLEFSLDEQAALDGFDRHPCLATCLGGAKLVIAASA